MAKQRPVRMKERGRVQAAPPAGLEYAPDFVGEREAEAIVRWLGSIRPLWEQRFSERTAAARGGQRRLLRPVYWLGSWQFACLDYYRPPAGIHDRCVEAEPYPAVLARMVARIERRARRGFGAADVPPGWRLNSCLVNLYGARIEAGRRRDCARVGEHRDFEPGPVASISLGERALFDFVTRGGRDAPARVLQRLWLEDRSLLLFGGDHWKRRTLHRVVRVERRSGARFPVQVQDFETRRVNLTFRYVPEPHVVPFAALADDARGDVRPYVEELARGSAFFARALGEAR